MSDETISLFIDLYLDADVNRDLAELLRKEGFEAISAWELGQQGWEDPQQLEYAVSKQMALLTHNRDDYIRLAQEYERTGRDHHGIIVSRQLPLGEMRKLLLRLLDSVTADDMKNNFRYLSDFADR